MFLILTFAFCFVLIWISSASIIYVGTPAGLSISKDDGTTWTSKKVGYVNTIFSTMDNVTYVGTTTGLLMTDDQGKTWTSKLSGNVKMIAVSESNPNLIAVGLDDNRMAVSTDQAESWVKTKIVDFPLRAIAEQNNNLYVATTDGISTVHNFTEWVTKQVGEVHSIGLGCNTVYIGTENGILRTVDAGERWTPWGLQGHRIKHMYVYGSSLYTYDDINRLAIRKNNTWKTGMGPNKTSAIVADNKNIYLGQSDNGGLAISHDGGSTWVIKTQANNGLVCDTVHALSIE